MRVRTAVGISAGFIALKAALTALALAGWSAIPQRRWPPGHWHLELGALAEWLAAFAAAGAAAVALQIAASDRRARSREREESALAQARLVREEFERHTYAQDFALRIHNYGRSGILDVYIEEVGWLLEPDAHWRDTNQLLQIVKPDNEALAGGSFRVSFVDKEGQPFPRKLGTDRKGNPQFAETRGLPDVVYSFMDLHGVRWRTGTSIETPERVNDG